MKNSLRKTLSILLISITVGGFATASYFLSRFLIERNNADKVQLVSISFPETVIKGESLESVILLEISGRKGIFIQRVEFEIYSAAYDLNGSIRCEVNRITEHTGNYNLTVLIEPFLNATTGYFALNVGEYAFNSLRIIFEKKIPVIQKDLDSIFQVINPTSEELLENGSFQNDLVGWNLLKKDNNLTNEIIVQESLNGKSFFVYNNQNISSENSTWISISQTINSTNSHFLSFNQYLEGDNFSIEVNLLINGITVNMGIVLDALSEKEQLIYYGNSTSLVEITLQINFFYAEIGTKLYLDDISIAKYEHRVFVVMLNDNWEIIGNEVGRKNLFESMFETSFFFERYLGIKLIPILELEWYPNNTSKEVVDLIALNDAGELLNLQDDWDIVYGRSSENHGFDLLLSFSNRTSEHYGFAYYERNAAFHFGQSEELGEYSWISIVEDWAENLIQHEISHNFGALDRDRTVDPPSVMSKPSTPEQAIADFTTNLLWLQVNNWLLEDILLMLKNRAMFD
ncbi:MAG: hypothetical protein ACW96U_01310 [Candidatus Heimdallarchaeaceae archaeon]